MLLLLTRAFIPEEIKRVIKGADYASNIYEYIPLRSKSIYPSFISIFEFNLANSALEDVEINYDSTIANSYSFFVSFVPVILIHIFICILKITFSKLNENEHFILRKIGLILEKAFNLLTFDYYIRNILEISQFLLISSIYEVNELNTSEFLRIFSFIFSILIIFSYIFYFSYHKLPYFFYLWIRWK